MFKIKWYNAIILAVLIFTIGVAFAWQYAIHTVKIIDNSHLQFGYNVYEYSENE